MSHKGIQNFGIIFKAFHNSPGLRKPLFISLVLLSSFCSLSVLLLANIHVFRLLHFVFPFASPLRLPSPRCSSALDTFIRYPLLGALVSSVDIVAALSRSQQLSCHLALIL